MQWQRNYKKLAKLLKSAKTIALHASFVLSLHFFCCPQNHSVK